MIRDTAEKIFINQAPILLLEGGSTNFDQKIKAASMAAINIARHFHAIADAELSQDRDEIVKHEPSEIPKDWYTLVADDIVEHHDRWAKTGILCKMSVGKRRSAVTSDDPIIRPIWSSRDWRDLVVGEVRWEGDRVQGCRGTWHDIPEHDVGTRLGENPLRTVRRIEA
jgi:hypothetical protein